MVMLSAFPGTWPLSGLINGFVVDVHYSAEFQAGIAELFKDFIQKIRTRYGAHDFSAPYCCPLT